MLQGTGKLSCVGKLKYGGNLTLQFFEIAHAFHSRNTTALQNLCTIEWHMI